MISLHDKPIYVLFRSFLDEKRQNEVHVTIAGICYMKFALRVFESTYLETNTQWRTHSVSGYLTNHRPLV